MNKSQATWALAALFIVYLLLGEAPPLTNLPLFSEQNAFVLLVVLYLVSSFANWGVVKASKFLFGTWTVSFVMEFVGVKTGYPFGHYSYTSALGATLGPVPVFIPFLWCALGYFCLQASGESVLEAAALMVILDISLDPIFAGNLWDWRASPGPFYFGVPVLNFLGWFFTSVLVFAVFWALKGEGDRRGRRFPLWSVGSSAGTGFYFAFGLVTVLFDLSSGLPKAAAVSAVLYLAAAVALWRLGVEAKKRAYY